MLEIIAIAVFGTVLAGLWDLKTTEVPDQLPYAMIGIGILYWLADAFVTKAYANLVTSLLVGSAILAFGMIMYKKGQWGGADAWIFAAIGYMIPIYDGTLFIFPYIANFAVVAVFYTVVYAIGVGILHPEIFRLAGDEIRKKAKFILLPLAAFIGTSAAYLVTGEIMVLPVALVLGVAFLMAVFFMYAKTVEKNYFTRKIPVGKLRKGDVLQEGNWVGITEKDIAKIRSKHKFVTIKDGVRFVPVFAIALVVTLLFGNVFLMIFG